MPCGRRRPRHTAARTDVRDVRSDPLTTRKHAPLGPRETTPSVAPDPRGRMGDDLVDDAQGRAG